jgi:hypothetical protein
MKIAQYYGLSIEREALASSENAAGGHNNT